MKKQTQPIPTVSKYTILRQLSNLIPPHLIPKLARETGVEEKVRTFSAWSHVVSLLNAAGSNLWIDSAEEPPIFRNLRVARENDAKKFFHI